MKRFKIEFEYDGTNFYGYQRQKDKRTVQNEIEAVLKRLSGGKNVLITSSGRTDRKVHAKGQVASFVLDMKIGVTKLKKALNTYLPDDIYIHTVVEIDDQFHPRFHAIKKEYTYLINENEFDVFTKDHIYQYGKKLNIVEMRKAAKHLVGTHDYRAFVSENKTKDNCIRTIYKITIKRVDNNIMVTFLGSGFMKYQVRNMMGALIKVGAKEIPQNELRKMLRSKDRTVVPKAAPPEGLYLEKVYY